MESCKTENRNRLDVHVRWMLRRDLPEVLDIEWACFEYPWDEEDFIKCLRRRSMLGMVAECVGAIAGYMVYTLYRGRIHIENFAVAADARRCGVGRQMA